jgi:hypothetical protein
VLLHRINCRNNKAATTRKASYLQAGIAVNPCFFRAPGKQCNPLLKSCLSNALQKLVWATSKVEITKQKGRNMNKGLEQKNRIPVLRANCSRLF